MQIWDLRIDGVNDYAVLVHAEDDVNFRGLFTTDGKPKHWTTRPKLVAYIEKRKKIAKPRADISYLTSGAIILNEKAHQALRDFLQPFGQFLEVDCNGGIEYFYNVTHLISCIDYEHSEKMGTAVTQEVFLSNAVPDSPLVFKDPYTVRSYIYLNQAGKEKFEQITRDAGLFGARFVEAGKGLN